MEVGNFTKAATFKSFLHLNYKKLSGFSEPFKLERNRNSGGVLIYFRENILSKLLDYKPFDFNFR